MSMSSDLREMHVFLLQVLIFGLNMFIDSTNFEIEPDKWPYKWPDKWDF